MADDIPTLSIECPSFICLFLACAHVFCFFLDVFCFVFMPSLELCRCSSYFSLSNRPRTTSRPDPQKHPPDTLAIDLVNKLDKKKYRRQI